ncbi:MAG: hypothetical protein HGA31_01745 [Candidatus Moranbacteria bacterium]|nr:hypothetical protein [Candidatus Moranbacteria bacterium]
MSGIKTVQSKERCTFYFSPDFLRELILEADQHGEITDPSYCLLDDGTTVQYTEAVSFGELPVYADNYEDTVCLGEGRMLFPAMCS